MDFIKQYFLEFLKWYNIRKFKTNINVRTALYEKIASLLEQNISVNVIVEELLKVENKKPIYERGPVYYFLLNAIDVLNKGETFSKSLKGWVSDNEYSLISAGDSSGDLSKSFEMAIDLSNIVQNAKSKVIQNLLYPAIVFSVAILLLYGLASQLLPVLETMIPVNQWSPESQNLHALSNFIEDNIILVIIGIIGGIIGVYKSFGFLTGKIRKYLDRYPPYSTYKSFQSSIFLISIATLLKAGISFRESIYLIRSQSNNYIRENLQEMLSNLEKGWTPGTSMNTDFMGKGGDDIEIYGLSANFDKAMESLGKRFMEIEVKKIVQTMKILGYVAMFTVAGLIIWVLLTFFDITGQMGT